MRSLVVAIGLVAAMFSLSTQAANSGKPVEIKTALGTFIDAYQVGSIEAPRSVIIIHDRWGLDKLAMDLADRFAEQGYLALAIDLYDGRRAKKNDYEHATALMRQIAPEWVDVDLKGALAYLTKQGRKISVVGIGYGGGAAMRAAVIEPQAVTSTVNILGKVLSNPDQLRLIQGPVLVMHGKGDGWVGPNELEDFEVIMNKLHSSLQMVRMDGTPGVLDPENKAFSKTESENALRRAMEFVADSQ